MNNQDINKAMDLAKMKQNLMEDFLRLTETQAEAINNYNYETILNTIKQKQHIIEQINLLNLNNQAETAGDSEETRQINDRTRELIAKVMVIDDKNRALLQKLQAQTFEKLKNARRKRATHALYRGKNIKMEGILLDQKK